jgi:hypothetical protein
MPKQTLQDVVHEWEGETGVTDATMLATQLEVIADELRTANLIALANSKWAKGMGWPTIEKLGKVIDERLGLA